MTLEMEIIERAKLRLEAAYSLLPDGYFVGRDATTYLFNNITKLADSEPALDTPIGRVIRANTEGAPVSLYFGVPWCEKICSFCNFAYSTSQSDDIHAGYIRHLHDELNAFEQCASPDYSVASIYFGGGTPTILSRKRLAEYLSSVIGRVRLAERHSVSCEFSTSTISLEKLKIMQDVGVTRISTGVQSLDDSVRARANLVGTGDDALKAVQQAQECFLNFNIDLIYGHPYQTNEDWYRTVAAVAGMRIPSITLYRLEVKQRTTFKKAYSREGGAFADEQQARLHYFIAREILEANGYVESPLGWWIQKETLVSAPNWQAHLRAWRDATPYFGFGQGAFSLVKGAYYQNHQSLSSWQKAIESGDLPIQSTRQLSPHVQDVNQLMRLLRVARSVDLAELVRSSELEEYANELRDFFEQQANMGLIRRDGSMWTLTEAGESLVHWIFGDMIDLLVGTRSIAA